MDGQLLYRIEEASKLLNMSRSVLFTEMQAGRLKSIRIGRSRRISRAALEEYVADLEAAEAIRGDVAT